MAVGASALAGVWRSMSVLQLARFATLSFRYFGKDGPLSLPLPLPLPLPDSDGNVNDSDGKNDEARPVRRKDTEDGRQGD